MEPKSGVGIPTLSKPLQFPALGWVIYQFLCFWGRYSSTRIFHLEVGEWGSVNPCVVWRSTVNEKVILRRVGDSNSEYTNKNTLAGSFIFRVSFFISGANFHSSSLPSFLRMAVQCCAKSLQSCLTLCDPIDGSPPGSSVPGILQARTLEWVAISFPNAWKWKMKVKLLSRVWLFSTPWTAAYQAPPSLGFSRQEYWSGVPLPSPRLASAAFGEEEDEFDSRKLLPPSYPRMEVLAVNYLKLPGGASGKEPACQCRRLKRCGLDPWVGKIPWRKAWELTPVFLLGEYHGQRSLVDSSPGGYSP